MPALLTTHTRVTCQCLLDVVWRPWSAWVYTEPVAVFRCWLPDGRFPDSYETVLTADELTRARRYRQPEDQQRFCTARYWVRVLLGRCTGQSPAAIRIMPGINGKPRLEDPRGWAFNVAHSGRGVLIAVAKSQVGVDMEESKTNFDVEGILPGSFSPQERQFIATSSDVRSAFYHLWTRKEALLKATAAGLVDDLGRVPALDGIHTLETGLIGEAGHWIVSTIAVFNGYSAAITHETMPTIPQFYTLDSVLSD